MKVSLSWLNKFFVTAQKREDVVETLNRIGLTVDTVENPGEILQDFRVVEIISLGAHPNADKLKLCQVATGQETLQVVCGDTTIYAGMKGVLARPGMYVPGLDVTLKPSQIRGVESQGMFCSSSELGLKDKSEGVIKLDGNTPVGARFVDVMGLDDPVLDIELTPNRGDCTSIYGIARDLVAAGLGQLKPLEVPVIQESLREAYTIAIDTPFTTPAGAAQACPLFMGRIIRGVKNGPSPLWLQSALQAIGVRSISALVDVTNYMAYHLGRPMHVFDLNRLQGPLRVRFAQENETMKALDEGAYTLGPDMIVIADNKGPVSIAGIMGGLESGCTDATTDVFLESAYFNDVAIAKAGQALKIISDSRYRFERGVDPAMVAPALDLATQMILDLCGGQASQVIQSGVIPDTTRTIAFDPKRVATLGGMSVENAAQKRILQAIGCQIDDKQTPWQVTTPTWRHDMEGAPDLVEEIMRLTGYDHIELAPLPPLDPAEALPGNLDVTDKVMKINVLRRLLAARGLCESMTWSFIPHAQAERFGGVEPAHVLVNPISIDMAVMRPSLLPNLIQGCARNQSKGFGDSALFEVGLRYAKGLEGSQELVVAGVRSGNSSPKHWLQASRPVDAYEAKADIFAILTGAGVDCSKVQLATTTVPAWFHPGRSAVVQQGPKRILGVFGEIHPQILKDLDIPFRVVAFECFVERIAMKKKGHSKAFLNISPLQGLDRDFAFLVPQDVPAQALMQAVQKASPDLIENVDIFDVFQGKGIPEGMKSMAVAIRLQPRDKTLNEEDLNTLMAAVVGAVQQETGGVLRS